MAEMSTSDTEPNNCNCAIERILSRDCRSALNFEEQMEMVKMGKPIPVFDVVPTNSEGPNIKTKMYFGDFPFITGCAKLVKLFCWPCILFSTEESVWTKGLYDFSFVYKAATQHALSKTHIHSSMRLTLITKPSISRTEEQVNDAIQKRNESIQNNRYIVKQLTDVACFLIKQELSFSSDNSLIKGSFNELFRIFSENDSHLRDCINRSNKFLDIPANIQSDLIESITNAMKKFIKSEIEKSLYISIILEEKVDQHKIRKLITVVRYITADGVVCERFLNCTEINKTPRELSTHIFCILREFKFTYKLTSVAVNMSLLNAKDLKDLKELIKEKIPDVIFLPSYTHDLISLISNSVDCIKECKLFFAMLSGIKDFFLELIKLNLFSQEIKRNLPYVNESDWKYDQKVIKVLLVHKNEIENILHLVIKNGKRCDGDIIFYATGILTTLQSFDFQFLLHVFGVIFPMSDEIFQYINREIVQITLCCTKINDFQQFLLSIRDNFNAIWKKVKLNQLSIGGRNPNQIQNVNDVSPLKKVCTGQNNELTVKREMEILENDVEEETYKKLFLEIINIILNTLAEIFQDLDKLIFFELLNSNHFKSYSVFPEKLFDIVKESYKSRFYFLLLRNELSVIYESDQFLKKNLEELFLFLQGSQLNDVFPEVYKLVTFMLNIPLVNISQVRNLDIHRKIENYLKSQQEQVRMMLLALPKIEKELLCKLHKSSSFHDDVIDDFSKKNKWIDLQFVKED